MPGRLDDILFAPICTVNKLARKVCYKFSGSQLKVHSNSYGSQSLKDTRNLTKDKIRHCYDLYHSNVLIKHNRILIELIYITTLRLYYAVLRD